jgi:transposase InsO family protein
MIHLAFSNEFTRTTPSGSVRDGDRAIRRSLSRLVELGVSNAEAVESLAELLDGTRVCLHAVIDNFSRRIVAWRVAETFAPVTA